MPAPTQAFGAWGESEAVRFLEKAGYRIEARNFFTRLGELDIVAWDKDTLVFVEVKAFDYAMPSSHPGDNVHASKQRKLIKTATLYLNKFKQQPPLCRFDVITLINIGAPPGSF